MDSYRTKTKEKRHEYIQSQQKMKRLLQCSWIYLQNIFKNNALFAVKHHLNVWKQIVLTLVSNVFRPGTSAKVTVIITGDAEESRPRLLIDPKRKTFQRGGIDTFVMCLPRHLGNLEHIRIWHDNSGKRSSWYLSRLSIKDLSKDKMYFFMLDRWLAVEEDDGQVSQKVFLCC